MRIGEVRYGRSSSGTVAFVDVFSAPHGNEAILDAPYSRVTLSTGRECRELATLLKKAGEELDRRVTERALRRNA